MNQVQERMKKIGVKQVDLIFGLRDRGITVQPADISNIIRGVATYPKALRILEECKKIITELEVQNGQRNLP